MGYFSWKTQDTNQSISNRDSVRGALECKMIMPNGEVFLEPSYEGYGVFGGRVYYEAVAELNGGVGRDAGIDIVFSGNAFISPMLVTAGYEGRYVEGAPEGCPEQGFFYDEYFDDVGEY